MLHAQRVKYRVINQYTGKPVSPEVVDEGKFIDYVDESKQYVRILNSNDKIVVVHRAFVEEVKL